MIVRAPENTTHIFNLMRAIFFSLKDNFYYTTSTQITNITNYKWPSEIVTKNQHQNQSLIPIPTQDIPLAHHRIQRYHKGKEPIGTSTTTTIFSQTHKFKWTPR